MLGRSAFMALAAMGAFAVMPGAISQPAPVPRAIASKKQKLGLFNGVAYGGRDQLANKGARITMAQQKRSAEKSRNIKRHKAACRG